MMTFGRIGTLVGNVLFPVMLNMGCGISFYTLAGLMICDQRHPWTSATPEELQMRCRSLRKWYARFLKVPKSYRFGNTAKDRPFHNATVRGKKLIIAPLWNASHPGGMDGTWRSLVCTENNVQLYFLQTKSGKETYINSVILGCVSLIPLVLSGVLVNKVGKKNLFLVAGLISVGCTLGLRWTSSKGTMVALFSSDVAITQAMMSLNQAFTVELFPTTTR
ncbi:hypothetical protein RR46_00449 [Papilio xuthus]|uniref:Uncharacterized protein n=1 Tax=Papilio xuthus TaxID=66420 RepID=A0A0N0P9P3_PAPXU|nr:hypothetical protein RR46_00449 [Papilio xuthus]